MGSVARPAAYGNKLHPRDSGRNLVNSFKTTYRPRRQLVGLRRSLRQVTNDAQNRDLRSHYANPAALSQFRFLKNISFFTFALMGISTRTT